jgi:hypothetical protein
MKVEGEKRGKVEKAQIDQRNPAYLKKAENTIKVTEKKDKKQSIEFDYSTVVLSFELNARFQNDTARSKAVHTYRIYISMPSMTTAERQKLVKAILVANTVPPSNKIAPTIDLFGNDGTLVSSIRKQTDILTLQCCSRTPYTRRSSRYQPFGFRSPPTTHLPIEARMTQMGRSCKVIQKQVKLCCFIPISYRSH